MSTQLSRINWAAIATTLAPLLPDLHVRKSGPEMKVLSPAILMPNVINELQLFIGTRFTPVRNDEGYERFDKGSKEYKQGKLYSFNKTADLMFNTPVTWDGTSKTSVVSKNELRGMLMFLKIVPRGAILPKGLSQSSPHGRQYSAMVPLILAAWKKHQDIGYLDWDCYMAEQAKFTDVETALFMEYTYGLSEIGSDEICTFEPGELEALRLEACTTKSTGVVKQPSAVTKIYKLSNESFNALPDLLKFRYLECWVGQPALYHPLMLGSTVYWDSPPEAHFQEDTSKVFTSDDQDPGNWF